MNDQLDGTVANAFVYVLLLWVAVGALWFTIRLAEWAIT